MRCTEYRAPLNRSAEPGPQDMNTASPRLPMGSWKMSGDSPHGSEGREFESLRAHHRIQ